MHTYEQLFFGKKVVAQLLLSSDDFTSPIRHKNLQNALHELVKLGVVPIVNENDSVSVRELEGAFGDNDELSALLATAVASEPTLAEMFTPDQLLMTVGALMERRLIPRRAGR